MSEVILKVPRSTFLAKVKIVDDYTYDKTIDNTDDFSRFGSKKSVMFTANRRRQQAKKITFTEKFVISNSNQPLQISLKKVSEPSLSIADAKIEMQISYDKGFGDGQEAAEIVYQSEIQKHKDWINTIDNVTNELRSEFSKQMKLLEEAVLPAAIMISKHIIQSQLSSNSDIIINQAQKAIDMAEEDTIFRIFANPDDLEILKNTGSKLFGTRNSSEKIEFVPDSRIQSGGCIMHTSAGIIDASIESQLEKILNSLKEAE